jgi:anti-anti-sigma factor
MTIRAHTLGATAVLSMAGTMGASDFSTLHTQLVSLLRTRRMRIVLDFRGVDHVSYKDASLLAREFDLVHSYDGYLMVAGLSPYVRNILLLAGLSGVLERHTFALETIDGLAPSPEPQAS